MVNGAFRHFRHEHLFETDNSGTLMTDIFEYSVPYGIVGRAFDKLVLKRYMTRLLIQRNAVIKAYAETDQASQT